MTAAVFGSAALPDVVKAQATSPLPSNSATTMPTRNLGKTGYKVGIFSLGGQAALEKANNEANAVPVIERALDLGVNYIDTSSIYGGPERWSEQYVGKVMKHRRNDAFLATKTKERTRDGSMRMIEKSLNLLQTDHVDLWQLHDIGTMTDINEIFAKGGAMEALLEARDRKIVRYLGITGHYRPDALIEAIHRHPFDTILMAVNAADPHHYSFSDQLLPLAVEKQMGIIGMKVPARGRLLVLDPAAHRTAKTFLGRHGNPGDNRRHARYAPGHVLFPLAPGEHGNHRLRFHSAAGTKRAAGPRIHSVQSATTSRPHREGAAGSKAVVILPVLRTSVSSLINYDPRTYRGCS